LPGVNVEEGLKRVGHNEGLYRRILAKFGDSQASAIRDIRTNVQSGDMETATRTAHTLRGVAANLGAMGLSSAAQQVEATLKAGNTSHLEQLLQAVAAELDPLLAAISVLNGEPALPVDTTATPVTAAPSWATIEPHIIRLRSMLEEFDTDAVDRLELLKPLLAGTSHAATLAAIASAIANFDFDAALTRVNALIGALQDGPSGA
jgi:two-component system sensor histidine kinase/response regulator